HHPTDTALKRQRAHRNAGRLKKPDPQVLTISPQDRAAAAGFRGTVAETLAINPALAISGLELINQWYHNPSYLTIMSDCANTAIGVWSENSLDRTVVVAVYGKPH
ncbi:hypothetical protein AAHS21_31980, partial [Mycobacterium sp. 050272]